jgi:glycosyltransferase involved in cell wall biosynthesis
MSERTRKKERMKLKVAMVANTTIQIPPPSGGGGAETVIYGLATELVQRDVDVTVYCADGSVIPGAEVICLGPAQKDNTLEQYLGINLIHSREAYRRIRERSDFFDLIHPHTTLFEPFAGLLNEPGLFTVHNWREYGLFFADFNTNVQRVALSQAHQRVLAREGVEARFVVNNGLDLEYLLSSPRSSGRREKLLYLGRLTPEKGPDLAAELAIMMNYELVIAAPAPEARHRQWFEEVMQPLLDHPLVTYLGPITNPQKLAFFEGAYALVIANRGYPNGYSQPFEDTFGLVAVEAMAAGVPVIYAINGAFPETVGDCGVGIASDSDEETVIRMATALPSLAAITAKQCKARARQFSVGAMTDAYIKVYQEMLAR